MTTPGRPRQSGIPGPGRSTGIPTPSRSRSSSSAQYPVPVPDVDYMSRAFADAIKANDPAQFRNPRASDISSASSLSPQSLSFSVTGRPSSAASSSSVASTSQQPKHFERAKTPTTRPPSRHSDVFARSTSRAGRNFELGDNVRIESLGYEGTLRYVGPIDGKPGLWAGVELSGGFAGKGKNNGSVSGKQYFSCPNNCGVFVNTVKLSAPTVGPGVSQRPSSVASSRGGRTTPSISGRITPSASTTFSGLRATPSATRSTNGRVTPANSGRITPSVSTGRTTPATTPATRARLRAPPKTPTSSSTLASKITEGSRASKYVSMTAKQLSSRDATTVSPRRVSEQGSPSRVHASPSQISHSVSSPTRLPGSPFSTPKPGPAGRFSTTPGASTSIGKGRPSLSTPRARIPSAVAMPPPASPSTSSTHSTSADGGGYHDRGISRLGSGGKSPWSSPRPSPRPESATSIRSEDRAHIERLQARVDALQYENDRLRSSASPSVPIADPDLTAKTEDLQLRHDQATSRILQLETELKAAERSLDAHSAEIQTLNQDHEQALIRLEAEKTQIESRLNDIERQLEDSENRIKTLQDVITEKEIKGNESDELLKAKKIEISSLEHQLKRAHLELEDERRELGAQVDELRQAGQETIALYEERLSTVDRQRFDLENRLASVEAEARASARTPPPPSASGASSATEIDNETLRDQVVHLQKKVAKMEDILEDTQAAAEKEETALREKMRRMKEKEEAIKKDLNEGKQEVQRVLKAEGAARARIEEIEEALQESTIALEDARAEVEGLRTELANLDGLVAGDGATRDLSSRVAEVANRASADRARFTEEISKLHELLDESQANERHATEQWKQLRQTLDAQSAELEAMKKKMNRDAPINNGLDSYKSGPGSSPTTPSKHDSPAYKEEITGLKHIVQELQKENSIAEQRNKHLESENELLASEAEQLRQEVKILEENLDNSLLREEQGLDDDDLAPRGADDMARVLKELKSRSEMEIDQLRRRLAEAERQNQKAARELNKEISELEALVESKIYREDELEQEVERLRDKLSRQKKSSKSSIETMDSRHRTASVHSVHSISDSSNSTLHPQHQGAGVGAGGAGGGDNNKMEVVCEICERPGHDIFNCDLLKDDAASAAKTTRASPKHANEDVFCEDCEGHGHVAADCPHSLDVF